MDNQIFNQRAKVSTSGVNPKLCSNGKPTETSGHKLAYKVIFDKIFLTIGIEKVFDMA